jgi:hypothetical protein
MKLRKSILIAFVSAAIGLGAAGQAAASVYAGSAVTFSNLNIVITPFTGATVGTFNFQTTSTAQLNNGVVDATGSNCGGTIASNTCGVAPVLDAGAANATGSTVTRTDGDYTTLFGPGTNQYSNSGSKITTATLVDGGPTSGEGVAESEIQTGTQAAAGTEVSSITAFTFTFTLEAGGTMSIDLDATKYLLAAIDDATADTATSRASMEMRFTLQQNTGGSGFWQWSPQGDGSGCVSNLGATGCNVVASDFDMNDSANTATTPLSEDDQSEAGLGMFEANTGANLTAGEWSLTLFVKTSTVVTRTEAIPEPSTLFLLGAGLAGLGFGRRRMKS